MGKWKCWTPNSGALVSTCCYATSWGWEIRVEEFELWSSSSNTLSTVSHTPLLHSFSKHSLSPCFCTWPWARQCWGHGSDHNSPGPSLPGLAVSEGETDLSLTVIPQSGQGWNGGPGGCWSLEGALSQFVGGIGGRRELSELPLGTLPSLYLVHSLLILQ